MRQKPALGPNADPRNLSEAREAATLSLSLHSGNPVLVTMAAATLRAACKLHDTADARADYLGVSRASYYRLIKLAKRKGLDPEAF